ncbi:MAG: VWA domain-containing protein [Prevotellaceae bacterium]|jgi:Ca-activated chloride channel family protein|nr:VWA domain-containing protein [Prevotellaceae bacterium]
MKKILEILEIPNIPQFENPFVLWILLLLAPYIVWYVIWGKKSWATLKISTVAPLKKAAKGIYRYLQHIPFVLRCFVFILIIIALARPRSSKEFELTSVEGVDIMLVMDVSTSMLAQDFQPDRLNASKDIAIEFVSQRQTDRIGLTVFAGESFIQCPPTTDRATLINLIAKVQTDLIEDGTAIGNGLATAVSRLKNSDAKSKVVILMTDGVNNYGNVTPQSALEIAKLYKIRVYTVGIGTNGTAPYPVTTPFGVQMQMYPVEIDEDLLKEIATQTGGQYFRATDNTKLVEIYSQINEMEKTKSLVDSFPVYKEEFLQYALAAFCILMFEIIFRLFILRRIP